MKKYLPLLLLVFVFPLTLQAQQVGLKTNLLYWATTTPNLGVEVALSPKMTFNVTGGANPWTFGSKEENKKIQHWLVDAQLRFWPYEKWDGHFLAPQAYFVSYNAGGVNLPLVPLNNMKKYRYEGYGTGVGFTYGYQWFLGSHWNLELSIGVGYMYLNYKKYDCHKCGGLLEKTSKHWFGPTNAGVTFIYLFKSRK